MAYQASLIDLENKTAAHAKLSAQGGKEEKTAAAAIDVQKSEMRADQAKTEFMVISARLLREIQRFQDGKRLDFKSIVCDFVQLQIDHYQEIETAWQEVLPKLQANEIPSTSAAPLQQPVSPVEGENSTPIQQQQEINHAQAN